MIKAVLVDDEILVLNLLERMINETNDIQVMATYTDPERALVEIPRLHPDILFLDVDMPELNGIELGTRLLESVENEDMAIVFVTAYEEYAIQAFKLNAIHYILKPVDATSVDEVMNRVYQKRGMVQTKGSDGGEINVFGHMHLRVNGNKIDFLTAKIEELLALLVIHREKGISKWMLIEHLWENTTTEKSQQNLYTAIFRLKKTLQDAGIKVTIESKNNLYRIDLQHVTCDLIEFERYRQEEVEINEHTIAEFEKAISMYQGDLLDGKDSFWCLYYRDKYYQQFLHLVRTAATYYIEKKQRDDLKKLYNSVEHLLMEEDYYQLKKEE